MNKRWFWIIVIAMHAICFGKQLFFKTSFLQDSKEYIFAAENLINHSTLYAWDFKEPFNENWLTKRPFLYPAILAFVKLISFGSNPLFIFLILLFQNIISIYLIRYVEKMIIRLKGAIDYKTAVILLIFTPAQAIYANLIMSEIWLQLILILMVGCLLFNKNDLTKTGLLGVLSIAAMSLKPVMLFTAFCLPVYCLINFPFKIVPKQLLLSIIPALFLLCVCAINQYRTGYFQYSSITTINLFQYNTYTLLINKYGLAKADSIIDNIQLHANHQPTYALKQHYLQKESGEIIRNNIGLYTWLHIRGMGLCLLDPGRFDITQFFNLSHTSNLVYEINKKNNLSHIIRTFINPLGLFLFLIFLSNLYKILFGIRFAISKLVPLGNKLLLLFIPCYMLILTGPIGSSRFALPFFPVYLMIVLIAQKERKFETHS